MTASEGDQTALRCWSVSWVYILQHVLDDFTIISDRNQLGFGDGRENTQRENNE